MERERTIDTGAFASHTVICGHTGPGSEWGLLWGNVKYKLCTQAPKHRIQIRIPACPEFVQELTAVHPAWYLLPATFQAPSSSLLFQHKCPFLSGGFADLQPGRSTSLSPTLRSWHLALGLLFSLYHLLRFTQEPRRYEMWFWRR